MSADGDQCSKGYDLINGKCVPRMSGFRPAMYRSIFGEDPPPDPDRPDPPVPPVPPVPPPPPPTPSGGGGNAGNKYSSYITIPQSGQDQQLTPATAVGLSLAGAGAVAGLSGAVLTGVTAGEVTADVIGTVGTNVIMMDELRAAKALQEAQEAAAAARLAQEAAEASDAAEAAEALEAAEAIGEGIGEGIELVSLIGEAAAATAAADARVATAAAAATAATAAATSAAAGGIAAGAAAEAAGAGAAAVAGDVATGALAAGLGLTGETMGTSLIVMGGIAPVAGTTAIILDNQEAIGKEVSKDANAVAKGTNDLGNQISKGFGSMFN